MSGNDVSHLSGGRKIQTNSGHATGNIQIDNCENIYNQTTAGSERRPLDLLAIGEEARLDPVRSIIDSMKPEEIEQMSKKAYWHRAIDEPTTQGHVFIKKLLSKHTISPDGVVYLQILILQIGRKETFEEIVNVMKRINSKTKEKKIRYISEEPKDTQSEYRRVILHVEQDMSETSREKLDELKETIKYMLSDSDEDSLSVLVFGCDAANSIWVTLLMRTDLAQLFQDRFNDPVIQSTLQHLLIDKVVINGKEMCVGDLHAVGEVDAREEGDESVSTGSGTASTSFIASPSATDTFPAFHRQTIVEQLQERLKQDEPSCEETLKRQQERKLEEQRRREEERRRAQQLMELEERRRREEEEQRRKEQREHEELRRREEEQMRKEQREQEELRRLEEQIRELEREMEERRRREEEQRRELEERRRREEEQRRFTESSYEVLGLEEYGFHLGPPTGRRGHGLSELPRRIAENLERMQQEMQEEQRRRGEELESWKRLSALWFLETLRRDGICTII